jgi:hypothetical protein
MTGAEGIVKDSTGQIITNANIALDTDQVHHADEKTSDSSGRFDVSGICRNPTLIVSKEGFKTADLKLTRLGRSAVSVTLAPTNSMETSRIVVK